MSEYKAATCKGSYLLGSACGHCERCADELKRLNAAYQVARMQMPEQPPVAEGDVINKMLLAYDHSYDSKTGAHNRAMTAAYQVARAQVISKALRDPMANEVSQACSDAYDLHKDDARVGQIIHQFVVNRRKHGLAQADKPRTKQERVEAILYHYATGTNLQSDTNRSAIAAEIIAELENDNAK
jgi:hypothetical protein